MANDPEVIHGLEVAVAASPGNVALRLHLAEVLLEEGQGDAAVEHAARILASEPQNRRALAIAERATAAPGNTGGGEAKGGSDVGTDPLPLRLRVLDTAGGETLPADVEVPSVRLSDVGGMENVKQRLEMSFLAPMRNPQLRQMYGKSLRGGLLLWGPPGCGKTYVARATAGELSARFINIALADVLDMWLGVSEKNLQGIFELARRNAPCVLFIDELDALGQKRTRSAPVARGIIAQLLAELDGALTDNDGVFVLGATNAPWDIDPALRRPGRFDRTLLVLPPDESARAAILRSHLRGRPLAADIDVVAVARRTPAFSGADLAQICESAAESALLAAIETGIPRPIAQHDLQMAMQSTPRSIVEWFATARNFALFQNEGGQFDELLTYMKQNRLG